MLWNFFFLVMCEDNADLTKKKKLLTCIWQKLSNVRTVSLLRNWAVGLILFPLQWN